VKLWRVLKRFRGSENQFAGYVWTVFKNHLKDYFKKQRERHFSDFETTEDSPSFAETLLSDDDVMEFFAKSFDYNRIVSSMKHLDDVSYEVIHMKYIESKSYHEISQQL
jgi:RNA polymerase sigma factor (sigma-70 family)